MKILVIRFSSIGDIVLTTPVVRCLSQQLQAEIHFLTKKSYASIVGSNPYIDKVHSIQSSVKEVEEDLKAAKFDHIVDLHKNLRSFKVRSILRTKYHTFSKINLEKWMIVNLKWNILPDCHIVDRCFEAVKSLGVENDGLGLDFFIDGIEAPLASDEPYTAFSIGGAHATKRLPREKIREICARINSKVILLGGSEDQEVGAYLARDLSHVENEAGNYSLQESAYMVEHAQLVITHDTGLMHIAAAFQKPIITIWGNTIPEFGMYPYYPIRSQIPHHTFEVEGLSCRPCSKIGHKSCPKKHFKCMQDQDIESIVQTANRLLSELISA